MKAKLTLVASVLAPLALGLAGCGQAPPTAQGAGGGDAAGGGGGGADALQEVYAQLEGLEGAARLKKLADLASEEDGALTMYTSMNTEDSLPITEAFAAEHDIEVDLYRASSSDVLQRVLQESQAGFQGADVVALNGPEMLILEDKGLLSPLETPYRSEIFEDARYDTWVGLYLNTFAAAWNTDAVSAAEAPKSWEDLLTNPPGQLAMEAGDWDWMATLVEDYFMAEKGMSEAEAVDLFRQGAHNATIVDGHTTMAELLAAGEYDIASSTYQHEILQLQDDEASVEWETPPQPLVLRPNGIGIHSDTDVPASALLFLEYGITEAQDSIAAIHRMPANTNYGNLEAMVNKYDVLTTDLVHLDQTRAKWEKLYEEIVSQSTGETIEGD
jgi:iron(III) transport system substrate-binding protein